MSSAESIKKISRYELLGQLGEGGIGIVYKAMDPALQKIVAIKVLNAGNLSNDQQIRFQNEARALAELKHEAIPEIFNFSISEDGAPYIVMQFVEGKSLRSIIAKETVLSVNSAIEVVMQVCDALQHAHSMGIFHRDITPANIIISDLGEVKIVDFGLAKFEKTMSVNQFQTKTGVVMGSPLYMSPEQIRSSEIDGRSDIYSLGCVLFEMLSGEPPYRGETVVETARMHLESPPPLLSDRVKCTQVVRENLQKLITRCLEKTPEQRFQSMRDLRSALDALTPADHETLVSTDAKPTKKSMWLTVMGFAGLLLLCAAGAVVFMLLHDPAKEKTSEKSLPPKGEITTAPLVMDFMTNETWTILTKTAKQHSDITDDDFKQLAESDKRDQIQTIVVDYSKMTGTGIRHLKGMNVKSLKINSPNISDQALDYLPLLPVLIDLQLGNAEKLTLNGFKKLSQSKLVHLKLANMRLLDGALLEIAKMPKLKSLLLRNETGHELHIDPAPIASMHNLNLLEIKGFDFKNEDLKLLKGLKKLTVLNIEDCDLDDSNLEILQSLPQLNHLTLAGTKITDNVLEQFGKIKKLIWLDLRKCSNLPKSKASAFRAKMKKSKQYRELKVILDGDEINNINGMEITRDYLDKTDLQ